MKRREIRKLYNFLYDALFKGLFERPKLELTLDDLILDKRDCYAIYYPIINSIFISIPEHDSMLEICDSIIHELCHAELWCNNRNLNHDKVFYKTFKTRFLETMELFEND